VPHPGFKLPLDSALEGFAQGNSTAAFVQFKRLDQLLASVSESDAENLVMLRERGRILLICDALRDHAAYFDSGAPR
jgi:hypothetical protein